MYAKIGDIDDIMMVTFLSDVRNNPNSFEKLRAILAVSEGRTSSEPCKL